MGKWIDDADSEAGRLLTASTSGAPLRNNPFSNKPQNSVVRVKKGELESLDLSLRRIQSDLSSLKVQVNQQQGQCNRNFI